jgi:hypothetical protein
LFSIKTIFAAIGAAMVFFPTLVEQTNHKMLAAALGFSSGMLTNVVASVVNTYIHTYEAVY